MKINIQAFNKAMHVPCDDTKIKKLIGDKQLDSFNR